MADNLVLSKIPAEGTRIPVENKKGNALITFLRNSNFTAKQEKELNGIHISVYVKINDTFIKVMEKTKLWNSYEDMSIPFTGIPANCYLEFNPMIDKRIIGIKTEMGNTVYDIIPEVYARSTYQERAIARPHLDTEFDINVYVDVDAMPSSGGTDEQEVQQIVAQEMSDFDVLAFDE